MTPHIDPNLYFELMALYRKIVLQRIFNTQPSILHHRTIHDIAEQVVRLSDDELIKMVHPLLSGKKDE